MGDFGKLAMIHILVGYEANVLGTIRTGSNNQDVQGMLITAFVLYTIAILLLAMQAAGESSKVVGILLLLLVLFAGVFIIIGMALWGSGMGAYIGTIHSTAACFALLGAIFLMVAIAKGGQTGPS